MGKQTNSLLNCWQRDTLNTPLSLLKTNRNNFFVLWEWRDLLWTQRFCCLYFQSKFQLPVFQGYLRAKTDTTTTPCPSPPPPPQHLTVKLQNGNIQKLRKARCKGVLVKLCSTFGGCFFFFFWGGGGGLFGILLLLLLYMIIAFTWWNKTRCLIWISRMCGASSSSSLGRY